MIYACYTATLCEKLPNAANCKNTSKLLDMWLFTTQVLRKRLELVKYFVYSAFLN